MTSDLHTFTTEYFTSRTPSEWDFQSYLAGISKLKPAQTLGEVNSRFYTALKKIAASASSSSQTLTRVQFLMYGVQQRSNKRVCIPPWLFDFPWLLGIHPELGFPAQ
jgi:hypothetical protein